MQTSWVFYEHDRVVEQESIEKQLQFVVRVGLKPVTSEFQVQLATNLKNEVKHQCPVNLLLAYLNLRGTSPGPLFCWPDLSPISRNFFTKALADSLRFCDLDVSGYKSHSFRIGAASWAAFKGMSDAQIRAFGRWKSNAFLRYIRAPSIGSN